MTNMYKLVLFCQISTWTAWVHSVVQSKYIPSPFWVHTSTIWVHPSTILWETWVLLMTNMLDSVIFCWISNWTAWLHNVVHSKYILSTSWVQSYGNLRYFFWQTSLTCRNQFIWENSHKIVPRLYPGCTQNVPRL